ncbi:MAG: hypothetical protein ABI910_04710 [Gemmatimonadota bacterium]
MLTIFVASSSGLERRQTSHMLTLLAPCQQQQRYVGTVEGPATAGRISAGKRHLRLM